MMNTPVKVQWTLETRSFVVTRGVDVINLWPRRVNLRASPIMMGGARDCYKLLPHLVNRASGR